MTDWQTQLDHLRRDPRVPIALTAFFGLLLLWALIDFVAIFSQSTSIIQPKRAISTTQPQKNLADLHLFGIYNAAAILPNTLLQLTLEGTVVTIGAPSLSQALIASQNAPTKVYHVGDAVPGNAIITRITPEYVVLNDNGTLEKLPLPIETINGYHP